MFNKYLKEEYQFILKQVVFQTVEEHDETEEFEINISDDVSVEVIDNEISVDYWRNVYFEPKGIFDIKVNFGLRIPFKEDIKPEGGTIDWAKELEEKENPYMRNIITRASNIISNLTSSFGQQPLITPPVFIK